MASTKTRARDTLAGSRARGVAAMWLATLTVAVGPAGCGGLDEAQCTVLRGEAFEIVNEAHTCGSDAECELSAWPGCERPINTKGLARVEAVATKWNEGKCQEEEEARVCPEPPTVYCKQGLCVFRHRPGTAPAQ
ncbi:MAG: hypothetical protein AAGN82_26165 [Myxococcota bacterium]